MCIVVWYSKIKRLNSEVDASVFLFANELWTNGSMEIVKTVTSIRKVNPSEMGNLLTTTNNEKEFLQNYEVFHSDVLENFEVIFP